MILKSKDSGVVLIVVLWVLAIMSLLALGLSKRSSVDVSLTRNTVGKFRAYLAARAGVSYAEDLLVKNKTEKDTLYELGIKYNEGKSAGDLFKHVKVDNDTHFDILFSNDIFGVDSGDHVVYGMQDEDGKINLNAIDSANYKILQSLFEKAGEVDNGKSEEIVSAIIDWHRAETTPFKTPSNDSKMTEAKEDVKSESKDELYAGESGYKCKSRPFDSIEELLLVRGVSKELFDKIKNFITVFPKSPGKGLKINFKTAPDQVIEAFALGQSSLGIGNDEDLTAALIAQRNGSDGKPFTSDDGKLSDSNVSALEQMHVNALTSLWGQEASEYFRVQSVGTDELTGSKASLTVIIRASADRKDVKVVYWHRD